VIFLALLSAAIAYNLIVIWAAESWRRTSSPAESSTPPISILKPLCGSAPWLYDCLASFCRLDYPSYELLCCTGRADDPAVEVVRRLQRDYPTVEIRLFVADRQLGPNAKMDNLDKMHRESRHDILVISDDDIIAPPAYLRVLAAELAPPSAVDSPSSDPMRAADSSRAAVDGSVRVGVVSCPYRAIPGATFASKIEALGVAGEFFGGVFVARKLEGVKFALGSTMAVRKALVEEIGGFPALADYLADDYELGSRIAAREYRNVLSRMVVDTQLPPDSWTSMLAHQFRWMRTQAISRPGGHIGLGVTYGSLWSIAAVIWSAERAWPYVAAWMVARCASCWWTGARTMNDPTVRSLWPLAPLRELLTASLWFLSLFVRTVTWRGERFRTVGGRLVRS
jgi:ceramide glucosyltransferase